MVTCEIKLFWNNFEIISVIFFQNFIRNHVWNGKKIIPTVEIVLKLFQKYLSDNEHIWKYSWAAISLWNNFEIILGKFPRAEINLFQTDVDEGWNNLR